MFYITIAAVTVLSTLYLLLRTFYRLYLHPLTAFPGPSSAAISRSWQENVYKTSDYVEAELARYHTQYQTRALRIGPNELHITDPAAYRTIYSQTHPFPKDPVYYSTFVAIPHTLPSECDADAHRLKRRLVNPLFSKQGVDKLAPVFLQKIEDTSEKLIRLGKEGAGPINVHDMFRCLMMDIISEFAFGFSQNLLDEQPHGFRAKFFDFTDEGIKSFRTLQFSSVGRFIARLVPMKLLGKFDSTIQAGSDLTDLAEFAVKQCLTGKLDQDRSHPIIFDYLVGRIPEKDLGKESITLLVAGSDTTAVSLSSALHYVLKHKNVEQRLVRELNEAMEKIGEFPLLNQLEQIDYLTAVVKETQRISMPVPGHLPRVVPSSPSPALVVDGKPVPAGTVVGIAAYTVHMDTSIWGPDAAEFRPERWLMKDGKGIDPALDSYFVTFSKGGRSCIAKNLATAEMTMTLAYLFCHFKMELRSTELKVKDVFVTLIQSPGVLVDFKPRGDRNVV